ncbi:hypothetical protein RYX36_025589 [Vicia faba]
MLLPKKHQKLVQTMKNLVDEIWTNCPPAEIKAVVVQPLEFAGRSVIDKLLDLRKKFVQEHAQGLVVTTLDEVSCLVVRGNDVVYCPVAHAFAIVTSADSAFIYVDKQTVSIKVKTHLEENGIEIKEYTEVSIDMALLATNELDFVSTTKSLKGKHQTGEESRNLIWDDPTSYFMLLCFVFKTEP